jgi:hypothetical protein
MRDYFKSKFDYHWDMSGGWRFIAAPGNISFNQQKLIPWEQTPKQLPGNPRRMMTLAREVCGTVFQLTDTMRVTGRGSKQSARLHPHLCCPGAVFQFSQPHIYLFVG